MEWGWQTFYQQDKLSGGHFVRDFWQTFCQEDKFSRHIFETFCEDTFSMGLAQTNCQMICSWFGLSKARMSENLN